ncbi:ABC transporter substrate-binding protein [Polynucleobacter sp. Latsch14-2]|jgi:branched-chain amino acid transport system substrate-binding protein|uniref:ABC transporter substrate-binding protein n=1 Tax=Polynucleobacter sp. Latsch14-2 TaxID=2576920 RepID=UPI001C0CB62B|nr:ABC transporter substrate-binding protein [Polynucleobacter sp. Latsch14-2]MBU3615208.1 ABC transporter substrate-binding protein [Polynucleobacter sp. Latsch14-2]
MNIRHHIFAVAAAAMLTTGAYAADIKVGVIGPFTGGSSSMGVSMRDGVRLATKEINAAGGINGNKIVLVERDDEAKNERGVQIAQEFVNNEKVVATLGYINTGVALASQRFFQEAKIPVINNVATGTLITSQFPNAAENYVFRTSAADNIQAPMIAKEAVEKRGLKKVAILADSTGYGQLGREDLEKALKKYGVTPVAIEKFNIGDVDMTSQLLKAKNAGAEVVLTYAIGPELAQIANGMAKLGWKKPMIGSWTLSMASFIDTAGKNGNGATMPETFIQVGNTPKRKAFIDAYLKEFKPKNGIIASPVSAAQGYDSVYLLAAAIKQAGGTDGPKILGALQTLNTPLEGVVTTYNKPYSQTDHEAITEQDVVMGIVENGRVEFLNAEDATKGTKKK